MIAKAKVALRGTSPLSFSKVVTTQKDPKETHDAHEQRTWRERLHVNDEGYVIIPPPMQKNTLSAAAKFLGKQIPGKGKETYTKHIEAGIICVEPMVLPIKAADVQPERVFVPSDGRRGGASRVWKYFPVIPAGWEATGEYVIVDNLVTEDVFHEHLMEAGNFIGYGRYRPRNSGYYGRFVVVSIAWENGK